MYCKRSSLRCFSCLGLAVPDTGHAKQPGSCTNMRLGDQSSYDVVAGKAKQMTRPWLLFSRPLNVLRVRIKMCVLMRGVRHARAQSIDACSHRVRVSKIITTFLAEFLL